MSLLNEDRTKQILRYLMLLDDEDSIGRGWLSGRDCTWLAHRLTPEASASALIVRRELRLMEHHGLVTHLEQESPREPWQWFVTHKGERVANELEPCPVVRYP